MEIAKYKMRDIVTFLNGRAYLMPELQDKGKYRILRVGNLSGGNDSWYYSDLELDENKYCQKGDLLYAWACTFGPHIWKEEKVIYHYHVWKLLENSERVDRMYLYYYLLHQTPLYLGGVNGATMIHITKQNMEKKTVYIPSSLSVQQKIASILSTYDTLIENNTKRIRLLEQMAENLYKEWFVRFRFPGYENVEMIDGLPKGWKVEKLEKIADYRQEKISCQDIALYVSTENMLKDCQGLDVNAEIETPESRVTRVLENDILISNIRPYFKKIWFATQEAGCSNDVLNIHAKEGISSMFLFHSLRRDEFFDHMVAGSNGTKMPRGNKAFTMKFKLLVPPLIVMRKYDSIAAKINEEIHNLHRQSSLLSRQRDLLLPRLMSGKLAVKQTKL